MTGHCTSQNTYYNVKANFAARNNLLVKLPNSSWVINTETSLALSYSTAEYVSAEQYGPDEAMRKRSTPSLTPPAALSPGNYCPHLCHSSTALQESPHPRTPEYQVITFWSAPHRSVVCCEFNVLM